MNSPFCMRYFLYALIFFLPSARLPAQLQGPLTPLHPASFSPDSISDFEPLDSFFSGKRIAGAGESTHGTSEFSYMRLRLFSYLVKHHGFNIFFLEADYNACQRINRYIRGDEDDIYEALREVNLWPWITEEMADIIRWCRNYNAVHGPKLHFVGCDMQLIADDKKEFSRILKDLPTHQIMADSVFSGLSHSSPDSVVRLHSQRWLVLKELLRDSLSENHLSFHMMCQTIDQWFENKLSQGRYTYNFRDSCMAVNMLTWLEKSPGSKGFYFAHNWHVSNTVYSYRQFPATKSTGAFLKEWIGQDYLPLALYGGHLDFNAIICEKGKRKIGQFTLVPGRKRDLEKVLSRGKTDVFFIPVSGIDKMGYYFATDIGALYGKVCQGHKPVVKRIVRREMFDGILFIRHTHPTRLVEKDKKE